MRPEEARALSEPRVCSCFFDGAYNKELAGVGVDAERRSMPMPVREALAPSPMGRVHLPEILDRLGS